MSERSAINPAVQDLPEQVDVLIIGAGISGIGAAHHLEYSAPASLT